MLIIYAIHHRLSILFRPELGQRYAQQRHDFFLQVSVARCAIKDVSNGTRGQMEIFRQGGLGISGLERHRFAVE